MMIVQSSGFLSPGIALLKVIEGTIGEDFNSFAPTGDYQLPSTVYPYSALTIIFSGSFSLLLCQSSSQTFWLVKTVNDNIIIS